MARMFQYPPEIFQRQGIIVNDHDVARGGFYLNVRIIFHGVAFQNQGRLRRRVLPERQGEQLRFILLSITYRCEGEQFFRFNSRKIF
jgi:hypothetical protein